MHETLHDSLRGCLLGGAFGDSWGSIVEGAETLGEVPPVPDHLCLTDDTQLTLATCEALIEAGGAVDPERIAARFVVWWQRRRLRGVGASTLKALRELAAGGHWALVGRKGEFAQGNGAAMRIAPLAFCLDPTTDSGRRTVRDVSRITHHHDEAYAGALALATSIRWALHGEWRGGRELVPEVAKVLPDTSVRDRLSVLAEEPTTATIRAVARRHGSSGHVVESVPLALFAACQATHHGLQATHHGLLTVLEELISCGGDTDTNAAMTGQLAGALLGYRGLPAQVRRCRGVDEVLGLADELVYCLMAKLE